jgi:ADP-ribose pyrophosphatase YjhB (NUDIX family)
MKDILFKTDDYIFSYRVAGILIHNNKILLQKPTNDDGFAFPGGHVSFGETNAETLAREFKEEIGIDINVNGLKWVGEIFFPWGNKPCHQICLYYMVEMAQMDQIPMEGMFMGVEDMDQGVYRNFEIEFHWIELKKDIGIKIYPENTIELLKKTNESIQHFIYKE